jgi:hypothetical protein
MIRAFAVVLVGLALLVPAAQAEKKSLDIISCRSGTATLLSASTEATVLYVDAKGITVNSNDKIFQNQTGRCIGVISIINGKRTGNGYCKYMDPDGDFTLTEWTGSGKRGEGTWKYLYGTGKWKGVSGGGTYENAARGKPIAKGTYQRCGRAKGSYELKK